MLFGVEPPRAANRSGRHRRHESRQTPGPNSPRLYRRTRPAALDHERAKTELKALVPEDAKEASGHGVRAKRSKSGAISFESAGGGGGPCSTPAQPSAAIASALGQGAVRDRQPGKILTATIVSPFPREDSRADLPIRVPLERTRHGAQGARPA